MFLADCVLNCHLCQCFLSLLFNRKCEWRDLNSHDCNSQQILSLVCLPIPPHSQTLHLSVCYVGATPNILTVCNGVRHNFRCEYTKGVCPIAGTLVGTSQVLSVLIIAHYCGRVGGADSFRIDCCLIQALSSGVSSHSQISSRPLLSVRFNVFLVIPNTVHYLL